MGKNMLDVKNSSNTFIKYDREYISNYKSILSSIKNSQKVIMETTIDQIPILINLAKRNSTKDSILKSKEMLYELQRNFNEEGIENFIQKSISLIAMLETSNIVYGDLVNIIEIRRYLSFKSSRLVVIRMEKLFDQFKATKYDCKSKLKFIVSQLELCITVLEYCFDICHENIEALNNIVVILEFELKNKIKIGLDKFKVELLDNFIGNTIKKINDIKKIDFKNSSDINIPSNESQNNKGIDAIEETIIKDIVISNTSDQSESITNKFLELSNGILENTANNINGDFIKISFRKCNSFISTIETMNQIYGIIIDKDIITYNISTKLTTLIESNYKTILSSLEKIKEKDENDYIIFYSEIEKYRKMLNEAFNMNNKNIYALKLSLEIDILICNNSDKIKLDEFELERRKSRLKEQSKIVQEKFRDFTWENKKKKNKKRSFWDKFLNR
ncbi:MAG: hypothetical protein ACRDCB_03150 [Clostridium sp.]